MAFTVRGQSVSPSVEPMGSLPFRGHALSRTISEPPMTRVTEGPGGNGDDSEDRRDHQDLHR